MWRRIVALCLTLAIPASAAAGPLTEAAEKAARELALAQAASGGHSRGRLWTGISLIAGGAALAIFGGIEVGDTNDEAQDDDDPAGEKESDKWEKAMLGGGIAAAALGSILLITGRRSGASVSARPGRVAIAQTVRF